MAEVAAEAGVPEAMFHLYFMLAVENSCEVDWRGVHHWVAEAHSTGEMGYLFKILETPMTNFDLPTGFSSIVDKSTIVLGPDLAFFLLATRWREYLGVSLRP